MIHHSALFLSILLSGGTLLAESGIVRNGSFEEQTNGNRPSSWHCYNNRGSKAVFSIDDSDATAGTKSLKLVNPTPAKPHVTAGIMQNIVLSPGKKYTLSFDARGRNVNGLKIILGKRWKINHPVRNIPAKWKHFEFDFTPEEADFSNIGNGSLELHLLTTDICDQLFLDNLRITPAIPPVIGKKEFQKRKILMIPEIQKEWRTLKSIPQNWSRLFLPETPLFYTGKKVPSGFRAELAFGYDRNGLIFLADVKDSKVIPGSGSRLWSKDSIQIKISQLGGLQDEVAGDIELSFSPGKDLIHSWSPQLERPLTSEEAELRGGITQDGYRITAHLNWKLLNRIDRTGKRFFTFNAVVNNVDESNVRRVAFLAPGLHDTKDNYHNFIAVLESDSPFAAFFPQNPNDPRELSGRVIASGIHADSPRDLQANVMDSTGKTEKVSIPVLQPITREQVFCSPFRLSLRNLPEGKFTLQWLWNGRPAGKQEFQKADREKKQKRELENFEKRLETALKTIRGKELKSRYLTLQTETIRRQLNLQKKIFADRKAFLQNPDFYLSKGEIVNRELETVLSALEQELSGDPVYPATYQYAASPVFSYEKGLPVVDAVTENGEKSKRPMFFTGYGHFGGAVADLPFFQSAGSNLIQVEIGPANVLSGRNPDGTFRTNPAGFHSFIGKAMKRAMENNHKIALLISPHYLPGWWKNQHPELKTPGSFRTVGEYNIYHPEHRRMLKAYLEFLIPLIAESPWRDAIHSLVLSNEPEERAKWDDPFLRNLFAEDLQKCFGTISEFNRNAGTKFASFSELLKTGPEHPAVRYAFYDFRRRAFAEWHAWIARTVKEFFPGVKVSAKAMDVSMNDRPEDGVDAELFAEFSDYNGNDNYMFYGMGKWISDWQRFSKGHDLQFSMRPNWIVNSENHIIKDGETRLIPGAHTYTATFQQYLQGVGGIVTWVWSQDRPNGKQPLSGSIYQRPESIIAQGRAALDANRLVPEISAFVTAEPKIALLYSPSSFLQNTENYCAFRDEIYEALAFSGHKIGFISEKQLASNAFKQYKMIIAPAVSHLSESAAQGLAAFAKQGGIICNSGNSFRCNPYGAPLKQKIPSVATPSGLHPEKAKKFWQEKADSVETLPVRLELPGSSSKTGIFFRMVNTENGWLINLVNYNKHPRTIRLRGDGSFYDLIAGKPFQTQMELPPLKPLFLRFHTANKP